MKAFSNCSVKLNVLMTSDVLMNVNRFNQQHRSAYIFWCFWWVHCICWFQFLYYCNYFLNFNSNIFFFATHLFVRGLIWWREGCKFLGSDLWASQFCNIHDVTHMPRHFLFPWFCGSWFWTVFCSHCSCIWSSSVLLLRSRHVIITISKLQHMTLYSEQFTC